MPGGDAQATQTSWFLDHQLAHQVVRYGAVGAILSWSFTKLAVAAKNVSVPDYLLIETAFTMVQWALVAPLTVMVSLPTGNYDQRISAAG